MSGFTRSALLSAGLTCYALAQTVPATISGKPNEQSTAYYNFAMGHLYAEMASSYGNRGEYVNKAIDFYKEAMKLDPNSSYIGQELAQVYIQSGQLERATALANELIKADPNNAEAHKLLGGIYARQMGDPDQGKVDTAMLASALAEYRKIAELTPKDTESLARLAQLYHVSHDDANAEKTYRTMLAADPGDDDAMTGLAALLADRGDLPGAIDMMKQAVEKNPDPRGMVALAELYEQNKDFSNAADTWEKALPLTNDNPKVRRQWANDLMAAGRVDEALKSFQTLANDNPKDTELQLRLIDIYVRKRDFAGAHSALEKARANGNSVEVRFAEAGLLDAEGKTTQAISVLDSILKETKKSSYTDPERGQRIQTLKTIGLLQKQALKTQDAIASFREIEELDPQIASRLEVEVIETLMAGKDLKGARAAADAALKRFAGDKLIAFEHANVLSEQGQYDAAIAELKALPDSAKDRDVMISIAQVQEKAKRYSDELRTLQAAEGLSGNAQEKQGIMFMRGAMYEKQKSFESAEAEFRKVLSSDPANAGAMNYLGYMLADRGVRLDEAQQLISKALEIEPGNGAFLDSLGWVHYHQNRLDQAAEELREALDKIGKEDPTVHEHLGDVYAKQGKTREAIQQWEASVAGYKTASLSEQDPEALAKVIRKLDAAKVSVAKQK